MEPGHPPRQDPPTEHSHDQVNGSPPRPKSRRGWMSDSPLDGGSGWPTSAYSIVPAPAPSEEPQADPAVRAGQETEAPPAEPAAGRSRAGRIGALVVGLAVLLVAVVGGVLATRDNAATGGANAAAATTPVPDPTTGDPVAAPTGSGPVPGAGGGPAGSSGVTPDPSGVGESASAGASAAGPAATAPPVTAILRSGTAELTVLAGQPDQAYDFDSGLKQTGGADATAGAIGLSAANGARFAVLTTADTPSLEACTAVPPAQWTSQVVLAGLLPGAKVCMRTSEQRYAWFMTRAGQALSGALYTIDLDYIVYKGAGD